MVSRLPWWDTDSKESACQCRRHKRCKFDPWVGKITQGRKWQPTPVFLPGEFYGQRSLADYSPWGRKELDTTERLTLSLFQNWIPSLSLSFHLTLGEASCCIVHYWLERLTRQEITAISLIADKELERPGALS